MNRRWILLSVVLALLLSFVAFQAPAHAAPTAFTAKVMTYRLNVRAAASIRAARILVLKADEVVTILGKKASKDAWHTWFKIRTGAGKTGWVAAPFVVLVSGTINSVPVLP